MSGKPIIEIDVSVDFYLENIWYESFYDKFIAGLYNLRYCRKSINDWKVILKHLNPKININYDELNRNEYGEGTN